jgi:hypothetical protein
MWEIKFHAIQNNMLIFMFLAYFPKMKVGLSNHQPVCVCAPTNNFSTDWGIFMKFGMQVMPTKMTSMPHFLIS